MPKDLLLDFGAVLIPIDQDLSYQAFEELGAKDELAIQNELFDSFERGELTNDDFLEALKPFFFRKKIFKKDLADAWNALCYSPIPSEHIYLLKRLKRKYRLHLVSNSNGLHIEKIKSLCGPFDFKLFLKQFTSVNFSHEMGHRKPEREFYEKVITEQNLKVEDCLFVDDRKDNIKTAKKLGIPVWHFNAEEDDILKLEKRLK